MKYFFCNTIYVEAFNHSGYYDKYPDSSANLSVEEFNYRIVRDTLLHEMGHFVDEENGYRKSDTQEFINIFYEEVNNFTKTEEYKIDNLGISTNIATPLEYYATAFSCFISYPSNLQSICPRTYDYFNRLMINYEKQYCGENTYNF